MKNSFASAYTSLALFFLFLVSVSSINVIQDSCRKAADEIIKYDFCVASLESNPNSKTATSLEALFPISIDIAISNATNIISIVSKLLEKKKLDNYTRSCLEICSHFYSNAPSKLQTAAKAVESKDYNKANSYLSSTMDVPGTCEEGFEEKGWVWPLKKENNIFFQLGAISLTFMCISSNACY